MSRGGIVAGLNSQGKEEPAGVDEKGIYTRAFADVILTDWHVLIGPDDQIDQNDYSNSIRMDFPTPWSGEITNIALASTESGSGSVQVPDCTVMLFASNPQISAGATTIATDKWGSFLGFVELEDTDYKGDANVKFAYKTVAMSIPKVSQLWLVLLNEDANGVNDAGGDNEQIDVRLAYRRDS